MRRKLQYILILSFLFLFATFSFCEEYRVSVSRKSSNTYRVIGKDILIHTKYCYEYVYLEDALLTMNGYTGSIVFLESGGKCDVEGVYAHLNLDPGTYSITLSHEDDDWYSILEADIFIATSGCYEYVYFEDAVLQVSNSSAIMLYVGDNQYVVESVYERLKL